jgi:hypothetical protein
MESFKSTSSSQVSAVLQNNTIFVYSIASPKDPLIPVSAPSTLTRSLRSEPTIVSSRFEEILGVVSSYLQKSVGSNNQEESVEDRKLDPLPPEFEEDIFGDPQRSPKESTHLSESRQNPFFVAFVGDERAGKESTSDSKSTIQESLRSPNKIGDFEVRSGEPSRIGRELEANQTGDTSAYDDYDISSDEDAGSVLTKRERAIRDNRRFEADLEQVMKVYNAKKKP